ncbi:MAG: ABC transporter ATP-binding protein [Phycisphaerales bacterium]
MGEATEHLDEALEMIRVEGLYKSFGDTEVLQDISLSIRCGEIVAIVGGSGCGKTVLLEHLIGHHRPDAGRVLVRDFDSPDRGLLDIGAISGDELDRLRVHWAVVFQRNALFTGSVFENIALWLREVRRLDDEAIRPIAESALRSVGLDPGETMSKDRDELSGGMAKRVAVARALAMDPQVIFYDEPTTGLDPKHAAQIHDLILQTHKRPTRDGMRRTTTIVTHDKDLLRRLQPRIIMLHEGRVYFDGAFQKFRDADSEIIRPYFDEMDGLHERPAPS